MYSGATSFLTVVSVVLHAVLGCCAHHQHVCAGVQSSSAPMSAAESSSNSSREALQQPAHVCCHRHAPAPADASSPEEQNSPPDNQRDHDHHHGSCGDDCTWGLTSGLASEQNGVQDSGVPVSSGFALVVANADAVQQTALHLQHAASQIQTPLRARIQVWRL